MIHFWLYSLRLMSGSRLEVSSYCEVRNVYSSSLPRRVGFVNKCCNTRFALELNWIFLHLFSARQHMDTVFWYEHGCILWCFHAWGMSSNSHWIFKQLLVWQFRTHSTETCTCIYFFHFQSQSHENPNI